jgi:hypothetical protein
MALHFRRETDYGSALEVEQVIGTSTIGPVPLDDARYFGFMIGPDSDHDLVEVVAGTDRFTLCAGAVIPVGGPDGFNGQPTIECVRWFDVVNSPADPRPILHVIGLTCPHELASRPRRAPVHREYSFAAGSSHRIAHGGRRHALIHVLSGDAGTLIIRGVDPRTSATVELLNVAIAADTAVAYNVGGTDHEELWPALEVEVTGSNDGAIHYYAVGELGGG